MHADHATGWRSAWRPTKAGWMVLLLSLLFYAAAATSQSALLLLLIGLLVACLVINGILARQAVRHVSVHAPRVSLLAEGEPPAEPWRVGNDRNQPVGMVELRGVRGPLLRVPYLGPRAQLHRAPTLVFPRRGVHRLSDMTLASAWPFGLVEARRRLALEGELVVHPAVYATAPPRAAGFDAMVGGRFRGRSATVSGAHFAGVRPIQPGDSFKHIHWKTSAKGQGLQVKTFDEELSGRIAFITDSGQAGDAEALDSCLRAAGSLIFAALEGGHHVEWIDITDREPLLIPPYSDGQEILDRLARVELRPGCLSEEALLDTVTKLSHRAALCLVLTVLNAAVLDAVAAWVARRRTVTVCLPRAMAGGVPSLGAAVLAYDAQGLEERA